MQRFRVAATDLWDEACLLDIVKVLSLAHAVNEARHEVHAPLCVGEIWGIWDKHAALAKPVNLVIRMARRPIGMQDFGNTGIKPEELHKKTLTWWRKALGEMGIDPQRTSKWLGSEQMLKHQVDKMKLSKTQNMVLIYKDSRSQEPCEDVASSKLTALLWFMRRNTLKAASKESALLLIEVGRSLLGSVRQHLQETTSEQIERARVDGNQVAAEILGDALIWANDPERRAFDYDLACRTISEMIMEYASVQEARSCVESFFLTLAGSPLWFLLAGAGEQEVYFPLFCALEEYTRKQVGLS